MADVLENKKVRDGIKYGGIAVLVVLVILDFMTERHHANFAEEGVPFFYGILALISVTAIVMASRVLGAVLGRREDYYDSKGECCKKEGK